MSAAQKYHKLKEPSTPSGSPKSPSSSSVHEQAHRKGAATITKQEQEATPAPVRRKLSATEIEKASRPESPEELLKRKRKTGGVFGAVLPNELLFASALGFL